MKATLQRNKVTSPKEEKLGQGKDIVSSMKTDTPRRLLGKETSKPHQDKGIKETPRGPDEGRGEEMKGTVER